MKSIFFVAAAGLVLGAAPALAGECVRRRLLASRLPLGGRVVVGHPGGPVRP